MIYSNPGEEKAGPERQEGSRSGGGVRTGSNTQRTQPPRYTKRTEGERSDPYL